MRRETKFWILFFLGCILFIPPFAIIIIWQFQGGTFSLYGIGFSMQFLGWLLIYCYMIYRNVYKGKPPEYPLNPPEGRMTDFYFPRTRIPRPIHEDKRRYPESFKRKKMKRWEKERKAKKK